MAFIEKTAFEPRMWNNRNNDLQNIPGRFQTDGTDADCSAGFACVKGAHQAGGGYLMAQAADGKGEVYFCNIWAYPSACNNDFGAGCDYRCKGLMGELYAYVMREAHGNVWITGPDFEKPDGDCDYITYSYFPDDGRICLMNMDYRNERKCVLHWFGEKDFITLKPGELRFMAAPKLDPDEKLNVK